MKKPPLALYIHWPWCVRKCPYCDFSSRKAPSIIPEREYVDGVVEQIQHQLDFIAGRPLESIFIGGGTPSLMTPPEVARLLQKIHLLVDFKSDIEITLEANPGTFEFEKFKDFKRAGINRLSVGVQSFNDESLIFLGRIHSGKEAKAALSAANKIFKNFNVDLMFGLPHQTSDIVKEEWQTALAFGPSQISYYQLTIEEGTVFGRHPPSNLPDVDSCANLQAAINEEAQKSGFDHYEISAYARPGRQCRHNLNYWEFGDYLGAGPAAHGKVTLENSILRTQSYASPANWSMNLKRHRPFKYQHVVHSKDLALEFLMNALRLRAGVPLSLFEERTGQKFESVRDTWSKLQKLGLVEPAVQRLQTTPYGWRFLNDVLEAFVL